MREFIVTVSTILLLCLSSTKARYIDQSYISATNPTYDFVIVGSGSAGSVLALRLSENPNWRILLLEIGRRPIILSDIPFLAPVMQFTNYAWNYRMERTPGVCMGMEEQRCPWPRGRGLGGTTLINYMIYTRGHKLDFDRWKAAGNPGWGYDDVLPYFLKSEDSTLELQDQGYHKKGGPLKVEDARWRSNVMADIIRGGQELGYDHLDYNGHEQYGFSFVQANTRRGVRDSGYRAFIAPAERRPNLDILTEARATKLLIRPGTTQVYGVEYVKNSRYQYVNVSKEVMLAAGAFNSPQMLMLSGVGPRRHLESLGIPVLQDLAVGHNLHDHITFPGLLFTHDAGDTGLTSATTVGAMAQWLTQGRGPLSGLGGVEGLAYINTNTSQVNAKIPDMEFIILNGRFDNLVLNILRGSLNIREDIWNSMFSPLINKPITLLLPMHLKPHSIGHLELQSRDPFDWPKFYGNHLTDPENLDVKAFIAAIRLGQKLMSTSVLNKYKTRQITTPIIGCHNLPYDTDDYWECAIRHISTTLHHQVGTCKMGPKTDPTAVVDSELRVHGMKGVRVADTSIIPFALNAHTNAPSYMVGEKAADMIKQSWLY